MQIQLLEDLVLSCLSGSDVLVLSVCLSLYNKCILLLPGKERPPEEMV